MRNLKIFLRGFDAAVDQDIAGGVYSSSLSHRVDGNTGDIFIMSEVVPQNKTARIEPKEEGQYIKNGE